MADRATAGGHRKPAPPRLASRDTLSHLGALRATRFTRLNFAILADLGTGLAFLLGAPTADSSTYRAMTTALDPLLGEYSGMWAWGLILVVAGLLIPLGQIAVGAPVGAFAWGAIAVFNLLYGAFAFTFLLSIAGVHVGMAWYIVRDRRRAKRDTGNAAPDA